jgi:hypothetical protein
MAFNLFVMLDAMTESQLPAVLDIMKGLGESRRIADARWYLRSVVSSAELAERLLPALAVTDSLLIIDCTHNRVAMINIDEALSDFLSRHWHSEPAAPCTRTVVLEDYDTADLPVADHGCSVRAEPN